MCLAGYLHHDISLGNCLFLVSQRQLKISNLEFARPYDAPYTEEGFTVSLMLFTPVYDIKSTFRVLPASWLSNMKRACTLSTKLKKTPRGSPFSNTTLCTTLKRCCGYMSGSYTTCSWIALTLPQLPTSEALSGGIVTSLQRGAPLTAAAL